MSRIIVAIIAGLFTVIVALIGDKEDKPKEKNIQNTSVINSKIINYGDHTSIKYIENETVTKHKGE